MKLDGFTDRIADWVVGECGIPTLALLVGLIFIWRRYVNLVNKYADAITELARLIKGGTRRDGNGQNGC